MVKNILYSELKFKIMFFINAMSSDLLHSCQQVQKSAISFYRILNFAASANIRKIKACFE